jgi:serine phosphatase RsbU (regulator of sigma subunit)
MELDAHWPLGRFASVGIVEVDRRLHELKVVLAAHPHPVLRLPGGASHVLLEVRLGLVGLNLGVAEEEPAPRPFPLEACLVLVSDGVLDAGVASRGEAFGVDRLLAAADAAAAPAQVASSILQAVGQHVSGAEPEDDVTIVVIARTAADAAQEARAVRLAA